MAELIVPGAMPFGLSTHLFHGERLTRAHLEAIAARDFKLVEIFATRTHVDYHDPAAVTALAGWLTELGLTAWSLHAPICDGFVGGVWGRAYSNASPDAALRDEAVAETVAAAEAAQRLGCGMMVLHLGLPKGQPIPPGDNDPGAMHRSLQPIADACRRTGVRLALEVIPNDLATPSALLDWLGGDLDLGDAGVCLDTGHAHLVGGAPEAIDALSGDIVTTHVHDNRGRADDHLLPFAGTIDWPATLMSLVKIGYSGPLMFELPSHGDAAATLAGAVAARSRLQAIMTELLQPFDFEG